jgi:hypothetical protein
VAVRLTKAELKRHIQTLQGSRSRLPGHERADRFRIMIKSDR